jgi:hypothetical protein
MNGKYELGTCRSICGKPGHEDNEKPHVRNDACWNWHPMNESDLLTELAIPQGYQDRSQHTRLMSLLRLMGDIRRTNPALWEQVCEFANRVQRQSAVPSKEQYHKLGNCCFCEGCQYGKHYIETRFPTGKNKSVVALVFPGGGDTCPYSPELPVDGCYCGLCEAARDKQGRAAAG